MSPSHSKEARQPRRFFKFPLNLLYIFIPCAILAVTFCGWHKASRLVNADHEARFVNFVDASAEAISLHLAKCVRALELSRAFYAASPRDLRHEQLATFVALGRLFETTPGVLALGYAKRVLHSERESFVRAMRAEGHANYVIVPETKRAEAVVVHSVLDLEERSAFMLGLDLTAEPLRRAAIDAARDDGTAQVSSFLQLFRGSKDGRKSGFVVYLPVYREGRIPATREQRREQIVGYLYSPLRIDRFIRESLPLAGFTADALSVELFDGAKAEAGLSVFTRGAAPDAEKSEAKHLSAVRRIDVPGRVWTMQISARGDLAPWQVRVLPKLVLGLGGLTLLFWAGGLVLFRRHREQRRLLERHAAQEARRNRLLAEAGRIFTAEVEYPTLLSKIANLAMLDFADWSCVDVLTRGGEIERMMAHATQLEKVSSASGLLASQLRVLRTGTGELGLVGDPAGRDDRELDRAPLQEVVGAPVTSWLMVPLQLDQQRMGVWTLALVGRKTGYTSADLNLAEELARRAAAVLAKVHAWTEERQVRSALESLVGVAPVGLALFDRHLRCRQVNDYFALLAPALPCDAVGRKIGELNAKLGSWLERCCRQVLTCGRPLKEVECSLDDPYEPGSQRHWSVSFYPVALGGGGVSGLSVIAVDISRFKRAEEAQRRQERYMRSIIDAVPSLVSYIDSHLCYRFNNASYASWFGPDHADLRGRGMREVLGADIFSKVELHVTQALAGIPKRFEIQARFRRGPRQIDTFYIPDFDEQGRVRGFVVVVHDVSGRQVSQAHVP